MTYHILHNIFQHDRRCQVIEMNKMEESALEKKVSLRLGLLFQELVRSIIHSLTHESFIIAHRVNKMTSYVHLFAVVVSYI